MNGMRFIIKVYNKNVGRYFRSVLSIILILSLLLTASYAWLPDNPRKNSIDSKGYIAVSADGLIMETIDKNIVDTIVVYDADNDSELKLAECTSFDGQNFYFPKTYHENGEPATFRSADFSDRNTNYLQYEFLITSDKDTDVWLSNESYILGHAADAIRISLAFADESSSNGAPANVDAVKILDGSEESVTDTHLMCLDDEGRVIDCPDDVRPVQTSNSLSSFYFAADEDGNAVLEGRELFSLKSGETKRVTMTVWLEGWDSDCTYDCISNCETNCDREYDPDGEYNPEVDCICRVYDKSDLQINLKFTIGMDKYQVLKFSDASYGSWLDLKKDVLNSEIFSENIEYYQNLSKRRVFVRDRSTGTLYAMVRGKKFEDTSNTTQQMVYHWTATVPSSVSNVEFIRLNHHNGIHLDDLDDANSDDIWDDIEIWRAGALKGNNSNIYRRFYALDVQNRGNSDTNIGRWSDKTGMATYFFLDTVNKGQSKTTTTITVSLSFGYYPSTDKTTTCEMEYVTTLDSGVNVYAARIPNAATARNAIVIKQGSKTYNCPSRTTKQNVYTSNVGWSADSDYPLN